MRHYYASSNKYRAYRKQYGVLWRKRHKVYRRRNAKALRERNMQIIWSLRASNKCVDCRTSVDPRAMQFDHVFYKRHGIIYIASSGSIETLFKEIAICQLVCANCHAIRTYNRGQQNG
jgi:hypothetical protein